MFKFRVTTRAALLFVLMALFGLSNTTATEVNNCCSVDRQCVTDNEWVAGYYAFQNSKCAAPVDSPQQSTSSQSQQQSRTSAEIDNCCFSGWQCSSDDDWTSGYFAFQHDHCFSQSHWEEQMRKRQSAETAARNSNQPRRGDSNQARRGNRNRRQQPEEEEALTPYIVTLPGDPPTRTEEAEDGTPIHIRGNDYGYMCWLQSYNPESHWCQLWDGR